MNCKLISIILLFLSKLFQVGLSKLLLFYKYLIKITKYILTMWKFLLLKWKDSTMLSLFLKGKIECGSSFQLPKVKFLSKVTFKQLFFWKGKRTRMLLQFKFIYFHLSPPFYSKHGRNICREKQYFGLNCKGTTRLK